MLNLLLKNGTVYIDGGLKKADVLVKDGIVAEIGQGIVSDDTLISN